VIGGEVHMTIAIDTAAGPDLSIVVVAHKEIAVDGRIAFERAIAGQGLGNAIGTPLTVPLSDARRDALNRHVFTIGLRSPTAANAPTRLGITAKGVYPIEVDLVDANRDRLARFV